MRFLGLIFAVGITALSGTGLWDWFTTTWNDSPLDRNGPLLLTIAGLVCILVFFFTPVKCDQNKFRPVTAALPLLLVSISLNLLARDFEIYIFTALTLLPIFGFSVWGLMGGRMFILILPSLLIAVLAVPGIPFLLATLAPDLSVEIRLGTVIASAMALQFFLLKGSGFFGEWIDSLQVNLTAKIGVLCMTLLGVAVVWATPVTGRSAIFDAGSYQVGLWRGIPLDVAEIESEVFDGAKISKFLYAHPNGSSLSVLRVVSDDVHDLHPPEYCLTGANWQVSHRQLSDLETKKGRIRTTELDLSREGHPAYSRYWFNSGANSLASVADFRLHRRLSDSDEFSLFLVTSIVSTGGLSERDMVNQFLQESL